MGLILILLAVGLTIGDKLDRTYLPPPGFKNAGGSPGSLDLPLEYPKLNSNQTNKAFEISTTNPGNEYGNTSDIQTKRKFGISDGSFQKDFDESEQQNIKPVNDQTLNVYQDESDNYYYNGTRFEESLKKLPQDLQGLTYSNAFERLPNTNKNKDFAESDESIYGQEFASNIPPGNNMYNDYAMYGSQFMYRPDTITSSIDNSKASLSNIPTRTLNSKQDPLGAFKTYNPDIAQSKTFKTYPEFRETLTEKGNLNYKRPVRPQAQSDRNAFIIKYETILTPDGFSYGYDTSNGIHADEAGTAVDGVKAKGSYSYTGDDGKVYTIKYTADENGFRPIGDHLPTPPPIPVEIQAALNQIAREQETDESDDGSYDNNKYGYEKYQGAMDRLDARLQDLTNNFKNVPAINNSVSNKYPFELIKKQKYFISNEGKPQTQNTFSGIRENGRETDANENITTVTKPYRNRQDIEYYNIRMQDQPIEQYENHNENKISRIPAASIKSRPYYDNIKFDYNNIKTINSDTDNLNQFKPSITTDNNSERNFEVGDKNRYLPESNQNKFDYQIQTEKLPQVTNMDIIKPNEDGLKNSFSGNNLGQPKADDLNKQFILNNNKPQSLAAMNVFDGQTNNASGTDENRGYYYNVPNMFFEEMRYNNDYTSSAPSLSQFNSENIANIPSSKTNYDENYNTNVNFDFDFPSTADKVVYSTEKYIGNDTGNKITTPGYQFTPNYYKEKITFTNYDSDIPQQTNQMDQGAQEKIPYDQQYALNKPQNSPGVTQKTSFKPVDEIKYLKSQSNINDRRKMPTSQKNDFDQNMANIPSTTLFPFNFGTSTRLDTGNPFRKNSDSDSTGYIYDKPSYNNNQVNVNIVGGNANRFPSKSSDTSIITSNYPNDNNNSNQKDTYIGINSKVPDYNLFDNSKAFPNIENSYNNDQLKQKQQILADPYVASTKPSKDFHGKNEKTQELGGNSSAYDKIAEPSQYSDISNNENTQSTGKKNYMFEGSKYIGDATNRPVFLGNKKTLGEDFSGPKRPQGFDPATGYYY